MENNTIKQKSILINGNLHNKFKLFCKGKSLKIGGIVENLIQLYLFDSKKIQNMIEEIKDTKIK
jgi:hypothetical protein